MNRKWVGAVALLSLLLASPLAAQPARELRGQVFHLGENGEKISEPGLIVTLAETGATDDTNDQGIFRLPLPPVFQPGDSVTISVDKPGWRVRYPLDGGARIPRNLAREIVPVELLHVGSKLFWTNDRIEKFIRMSATLFVKRPLEQGPTCLQEVLSLSWRLPPEAAQRSSHALRRKVRNPVLLLEDTPLPFQPLRHCRPEAR